MPTSLRTPAGAVSRALLERMARRAANLPRAKLAAAEWSTLGWTAINEVTGGLFRCTGTLRSAGEERPFSLVLKIAQPDAAPSGPGHWNFWRREAQAYRSPLLKTLTPPFRAARCHGVTRGAGGREWLWLEDLSDVSRPLRSPSDDRFAARCLGSWNARERTRARASPRWVCEGWLRNVAGNHALVQSFYESDAPWKPAKVSRAFPPSLRRSLIAFGRHVPAVLDHFDALPQTLCHFDASRDNLFKIDREDARPSSSKGRTEDALVAIDWAFLGTGPLGADAGQMLAGNLMWLRVEPAAASTTRRAILAGYLEGVRPRRDEDGARITATCDLSAALRAYLYFPFLLQLAATTEGSALWQRKYGRSFKDSGADVGQAIGFLMRGGLRATRVLGETR